MDRLLVKIGLGLIVSFFFSFYSCIQEEEVIGGNKVSLIQVIGRITEFNEHNVSSRGIKTESETKINNMCLFIFDGSDKCINVQYLEGANPTFIIDRELLKTNGSTTDALLATSKLYIVANVSESVIKNDWGITWNENYVPLQELALTNFLEKSCAVSSSQLMTTGFPMIGSLEQNLSTTAELTGAVLEIPLKCIYAKIVFNIQVDTHQSLEGGVQPSFQLGSWEVHNLPQRVLVGEVDGQTAYYNNTHEGFISSRAGAGIAQGSNKLSFTFYMPEHKVNPVTSFDWPDGIKQEEKQRYKPELIPDGAKPAFVRLKGAFTDHQGHIKEMEYDVYLGTNNYDDFYVERNCQYNNNITITGGTNHKEAQDGTISVDHRVTMGSSGYYIAIEQEATLDAHWSVVPMDVYVEGGGTVTVSIDNPTTNNWIRMERIPQATMNAAGYAAYTGIQDYFTTDLVTNTLTSNTAYACSNRDRIYFYIDENISLSSRQATVTLTYSGDASTKKLTFNQVGLKEVKVYGRNSDGSLNSTVEATIYIEDKEEYLYHYDPLNTYATEQVYNGLPWGHSGSSVGNYNDPYYDGITYTKNIVGSNTGYKIKDIPATAAEYCNNKTLKNPDGNKTYTAQSSTNGIWYLPAIREMEAIMRTYFDTYEEFQNNFYWSSASAKKTWLLISEQEESARARATRVKVTFDNGSPVFNYYESGSKDDTDNYDSTVDYDYFVPNGTYSDYSETNGGYKSSKFRGGRALRTEVFRIRAAYRPPTGKKVTVNGLEDE